MDRAFGGGSVENWIKKRCGALQRTSSIKARCTELVSLHQALTTFYWCALHVINLYAMRNLIFTNENNGTVCVKKLCFLHSNHKQSCGCLFIPSRSDDAGAFVHVFVSYVTVTGNFFISHPSPHTPRITKSNSSSLSIRAPTFV